MRRNALWNKIPFLRRTRLACRDRSGATAVEFAIILPVLVLTIMGILEFGNLFWHQVSLRYAVEQTARNAMAEYTRETFVSSNFTTWYTNWTPTLEAAVPNEVFGWDPSGATWAASTATVSETTSRRTRVSNRRLSISLSSSAIDASVCSRATSVA